MRQVGIAVTLIAMLCVSARAKPQNGLVARWDFDEGKGDVLHDRSGNSNHGKIHGAKWAKIGAGYALDFDGVDDYVDCGKGPNLDITGPVTLEAWVFPKDVPRGEAGVAGKTFSSFQLTYYVNGCCYWYVGSGGNKCSAPIHVGYWQHVVGTFDGAKLKLYVDGKEIMSQKSQFKRIPSRPYVVMGCMTDDPGKQGASKSLPHFDGMLDQVRVYRRALTSLEVVKHFNEAAAEKGLNPLDDSWMGGLKLTPYHYPEEKKLVVEVNYRAFLPLPKGAMLTADLYRVGRPEPLQRRTIAVAPNRFRGAATFTTADLAEAQYEVRVTLKGTQPVIVEATHVFHYPPPAATIPSPERMSVGPLLPAPAPLKYDLELSRQGGFTLHVKGQRLPVVSTFSYPHGGENAFVISDESVVKAEPTWSVNARKSGKDEWCITGRGKHYSIERTIRQHPGRIVVRDTYTNLTAGDIGIIVRNRVHVSATDFGNTYMAGHKGWARRDTNHNPTVFIGKQGVGIGMMMLDDVTVSQATVCRDKRGTGFFNNRFGLAGRASHTAEWVIYIVASRDYYDFINAVRRDLGVNGRTIEGGFSFNDVPHRRDSIISKEMVKLLNLKYLSLPCMIHSLDDPGVSIEGIEFMDFPKEMAQLKETMAKTRKEHPQLDVMFHIAHSLYATNKPERFADSRVLYADGKFGYWIVPPERMLPYFSKERLDQGWWWWIFYPTLDNSFGKAMMRSVDVMMDDMGATGVFCDGFMTHYQGKYTYDRWDGHTVDIDPETKTIKRKLASLNLICQDAYIAYCKKIVAKGGAVISDRGPGTLKFLKEAPVEAYVIEGSSIGPQGHLTPIPMCLGAAFPKEQRGMSEAHVRVLNAGCLYAHYYGPFLHENAVTYVYPFTVDEIHAGYVKGKEKFVTAKSGIYGWPGDRDLHFLHFCDARGFMARHNFLTTVDGDGVRTQITLNENETAVLKKIPVTLQSSGPVNVLVRQYDGKGIKMLLNAKASVQVTVRSGEFPIIPRGAYLVKADKERTVTAERDGTLAFSFQTEGQSEVGIEPVTRGH